MGCSAKIIRGGQPQMQIPVSIIQDLTTEIIPAKGDLPAVCFAAPSPEESRLPLALAWASCITGQGEDDGQRAVPLSSLVRSGYVASLRFERYLLIRLPRLAGFLGSACNGCRIFLERAFTVSFHCKARWHRYFVRLSQNPDPDLLIIKARLIFLEKISSAYQDWLEHPECHSKPFSILDALASPRSQDQ